MIERSNPIALIFKMHYKEMVSTLNIGHMCQIKRGETLFLQRNLSRSNKILPKLISCNHITLIDEWLLKGVTQPEPKKKAPEKNLAQKYYPI